jgi:hypothetical protein
VKVFATLAVESGRAILERGIVADPALLASFLSDKRDLIREADGEDADTFIGRLEGMTEKVAFRVIFG